ncbi:MAG TPA: acyl-CoA dehydrogenase family protein, partial [Stenomitos sp.]
MTTTVAPSYVATLERLIEDVVAPGAAHVDEAGSFPQAGIEALKRSGLLALISSKEVGGLGEGHRAAAYVVEQLAKVCPSTAMVTCMHYCAAAVIEAFGPVELRQAIARGEHVSTLAFSEAGSRSHFWAPVSTATVSGDQVVIEAKKSWVTSAGHADSYVWSSQASAGEGSTIWLVPSDARGLKIAAPFNGLGLRGNASSPITGEGVTLPLSHRLGTDGQGFEIMMQVVLPYFSLMNAAVSVGISEAATQRAAAHCSGTSFQHLSSALSDLPTIRAYLARMRCKTDAARALLNDALSALEAGKPETMLRVLEVKAVGAETSTEVTELA